jgi:hypothetical protein
MAWRCCYSAGDFESPAEQGVRGFLTLGRLLSGNTPSPMLSFLFKILKMKFKRSLSESN